MNIFRIIKSAIKAILRNPTRTFLTTLGIVIGTASVIALMEVGSGAQETLENNISAMGVTTINIRPGTVTTGGVKSGTRANLTAQDAEAIRNECPHVVCVSPVVSARGQIIYSGKNWSPYFITGIDEDYMRIANWHVEKGMEIDAAKIKRGSKVCLIGSTIVKELFGSENPIGKDLRIQNVVFKVIGTLKSKGANMFGMDQDDCVLAPWTTVKSRLKGAGQSSLSTVSSSSVNTSSSDGIYTTGVSFYPEIKNADRIPPVRFVNVDSISASADSLENVPKAVEEITKVLRRTHRIAKDADNDFSIRTMSEMSDFFTSQTKTITNLLLCVALISLLVGGIGIMNIMLVSVTERTREIGLRMAVGAKKSDILRQFLIESVVMCLMGGIIGIILGHGASLLLAKLMNWPSAISYLAIVISVGVAAGIGIVFGYYPAWKAARLDPIEALRYE